MGTARTNLHSLKNTLEILSRPELILLLRLSSSYKISDKEKVHELKLNKDKSLIIGVYDAAFGWLKTLEKYWEKKLLKMYWNYSIKLL